MPSVFNHKLSNYGGGERDRTDDLLRARQALSQLSYTPIFLGVRCQLSGVSNF